MGAIECDLQGTILHLMSHCSSAESLSNSQKIHRSSLISYSPNNLVASTNGNFTIYGIRLALSSTLAMLGMLQPRALEFLNHLIPIVSASYIVRVLNCSVRELAMSNYPVIASFSFNYGRFLTYQPAASLPKIINYTC